MLTPEQKALLKRHVSIDGDGNVVGNDNETTVIKQSAGDHAVQIGEQTITVNVAELRRVLTIEHSQVGVIGDYAYIKGGIHFYYTECLPPVTDSIPPLPPRLRYLRWLVGREKEKLALTQRADHVRETDRGFTVFLTGPQVSGRHALSDWLANQLADQDWAVAVARFWPPSLVSAEETARRYDDVPAVRTCGAQLMASFPGLAEDPMVKPWLNLMAQLVQLDDLSLHSLDLPTNPIYAFKELVRCVARRQSLLLQIEYLDWAIWSDLVRDLADEIAADRRPILLLVTLETPSSVHQLPQNQYTNAVRLAKQTADSGRAVCYHLTPVTAEELVASLTSTDPDLGEDLYELAGGDLIDIQVIWEHWIEERAVELGPDGHWRRTPIWQAVYGSMYDEARACLDAALTKCPALFSRDLVEDILQCAAIEADADAACDGIFTAEAIAAVFDLPRDDLIDFFDDALSADDDTNARPLLRDRGFATGFNLCQYSFYRPYLQRIWYKYRDGQSLRVARSLQLAQALEQLYAPFAGLIAQKLYLLYLNGDQLERARSYDHQRSVEPGIAARLAHVQFLIEYTPDDDRLSAYSLLNHGFSLCNRLLRHPHLCSEALPIAQELHRRAVLLADQGRQADACYYQSVFHLQASQFPPALDWAKQAVAIYEALSSNVDLGRGLSILGSVL